MAKGENYVALLDQRLPRDAPPPCGLSLASFFCCAGGIDLGFRSAGFELAFANDISEHAVKTFEKNLGHRPVHRDIRGIGSPDYPSREIDVLTGGFPCVTFSTAGRRAGVTDDLNGKLYMELCRVISEMRPRYFVAENVKGLLNANGGAAPKLVLAAFLRLGYRTAFQLVNMAEHGVPQTRERVIFVGVRADQWRGAFRFPPQTHRLHDDKLAPKWLPRARSLLDAIGDLPAPDARAMTSHAPNNARVSENYSTSKRVAFASNPSPTIVSEAANVQPLVLATRNAITAHDVNPTPPRNFNTAMRMARPDRPGPTCTASDGTSAPYVLAARNADYKNKPRKSSSSVAVVSSEPPEVTTTAGLRRMTVRECARVQSFPDWYEWPSQQGEAYRLVGNAVPPLYARRLAEAIIEYDERKILK